MHKLYIVFRCKTGVFVVKNVGKFADWCKEKARKHLEISDKIIKGDDFDESTLMKHLEFAKVYTKLFGTSNRFLKTFCEKEKRFVDRVSKEVGA